MTSFHYELFFRYLNNSSYSPLKDIQASERTPLVVPAHLASRGPPSPRKTKCHRQSTIFLDLGLKK